MSYEIKVRTDIINPHTYLEAELNYKELLEALSECGGYALFQQLYRWYGGSKTTGFREIKKLQELRLLGSEKLNNNKYVYLKNTALKYLKFRYSKDEVKETNINRIIQKAPFRPLMNSIYSFEYLMIKKEIINADNSLKNFDLFIISAREEFERDRFQNIHLGKIIKEDYTSLLKVKLKILGDRNGIFLKNYEVENNFKKSTLNFIWYDFDQSILDNPIMRVATLISKFINNIGTTGNNNLINCCNF